ncbi:MAG: DNA-binding response regulator [Herbinix sp.]|jgi:DNA-binding NarL/FixJ family response regulator|nr:DNA-binding response regulator [Herbinix sp.]
MIKVLIVDDISLVRDGIKMRLKDASDIEVIGMAADGLEAVSFCRENIPDIVLMDIKMPNMDGMEATKRIKKYNKDINIIILTSYVEPVNVRKAREYRCSGFIYKEASLEDFVSVIRNVYHGFEVWSKDILSLEGVRSSSEEVVHVNDLKNLTEKEQMLIKCKVRCLQYHEIAKELNYSEAYVRQLAVQLKDKLGLQSVLELAVWGAKRGL